VLGYHVNGRLAKIRREVIKIYCGVFRNLTFVFKYFGVLNFELIHRIFVYIFDKIICVRFEKGIVSREQETTGKPEESRDGYYMRVKPHIVPKLMWGS
jgi:hypothetical protein